MTAPILDVRNLKKYFPIHAGFFRRQVAEVKAVDDISFQLMPGEVLGIVGESGCGKSTTARAAIRLIEPTAGEIQLFGEDLRRKTKKELAAVRRHVQIVFQDPSASLNPRKTIEESIGEALAYHGIIRDPRLRRERVAEILDLVGLSPAVMTRYPHQFSGGQQQRICIGRAVALEPKLLVFDEAVSALDVSVQAQVLNLMRTLQEKLGLSYLFISHDLSVVRHVCDRVLVLYLGKVVESAPVEELFAQPRHPYTEALLSAIPRSHPREQKQRIKLEGEVPSPLNPPAGCPFHPRCRYAQAKCQKAIPRKINGEHVVDCILDGLPSHGAGSRR
jgi:oligopeptide/dipeptide ABC transporter ATP-binding protein